MFKKIAKEIFKFVITVSYTVFLSFVFVAIIVALILFYFSESYETEVLETKYDNKGRLILKKERGGHGFREGWFVRTLVYDTLGNLVDEFGYETHTKYRKVYLYDKNKNLIKQTYYDWNSDSVQDTTDSFEETDSLIRRQEVYQYYPNRQKSIYLDVYFLNYPQDTSLIYLTEYDSMGKIIIRRDIDYQWENIVRDSLDIEKVVEYDRYRINYDSVLNKRDTLMKHIIK